ncbi:MAG TPA: M20/M25/M40 family metallo-hydrolase [Terracidiphilus sp.]|nr:M20/M25/M40 family metallo-hydrolase [Terracidiphilus sp.]
MALGPPARARSGEELSLSESQSSRSAQQQVARIAELRRVHEAFAWFRSHARQLEDLQLQVTSIAAPPWGEAARSEWLKKHFAELGLADVHQDEIGNVFGIRAGSDLGAPYIALSAHLDTVFPPDTAISARRDADKLYGPGISDNSSGIIALLAIAAAMHAAVIPNRAPILFIGDVGEEGEGDLRGMRHIFQQPRWSARIASLVVLDGAGTDTIIAEGLGSRRYEVTIRGHGGHSWSDFGVANPIVGLARVIDRFTRTAVPATPKTTYNIGIISGGTSVNSIPESATMRVDTRSASVEELDRLERALHEAIDEVIPELTGRKRQELLTAEVHVIGNRPAADLPIDSQLLKMVRAVDAQLNNTARIQRASTDANVPLSLGREAIAIGAGGAGGGAHTIHEWYDPAGRELGLKRILLLTLALSGVADE